MESLVRNPVPLLMASFQATKGRFTTYWRRRASKAKVNQIIDRQCEIFLELGAGNKPGARGWVTIDMMPTCDIWWDLTEGIPFPDETIAKIYSSHVFEHFSFQQGQRLFDECRRVLKPDGNFSICVPNARIYLEAYAKAEALTDKMFAWKPAYNNTTRIDYVNYIAFMDGHHRYMFDKENLLFILRHHGFRNVRERVFDPAIDLKERDFESIYAEAEK